MKQKPSSNTMTLDFNTGTYEVELCELSFCQTYFLSKVTGKYAGGKLFHLHIQLCSVPKAPCWCSLVTAVSNGLKTDISFWRDGLSWMRDSSLRGQHPEDEEVGGKKSVTALVVKGESWNRKWHHMTAGCHQEPVVITGYFGKAGGFMSITTRVSPASKERLSRCQRRVWIILNMEGPPWGTNSGSSVASLASFVTSCFCFVLIMSDKPCNN